MALDISAIANMLRGEIEQKRPDIRVLAIRLDDDSDSYRVQVCKKVYGQSEPVDMEAIRTAESPNKAFVEALRAATDEAVARADAHQPGT